MPGVVTEDPKSRSGSREYASAAKQRVFYVANEPDFDTAYALVDLAAEVEWEGVSRKRISHDELTIGLWRFTVDYGSASNGEGGLRPDQLNFRLATATRKITQSLQTLYRLLPGETPASGTDLVTVGAANEVSPGVLIPDEEEHVGQSVVVTGGAGWTVGTYLITAIGGGGGTWVLDRAPALVGAGGGVWHLSGKGPDCKGAIGVTLDSVQGADVEYPTLEFSLAAKIETVTFARLRELRAVVRHTNDRAWNGFAAGELLFLGCEPTSPAGTLDNAAALAFWNVNFNFRYEPHQANVRVGEMVLPFVGGHEYVWARYGGDVPQLIPVNGLRALVQKPTAVYVERVYDAVDFDTLGIVL